MGEFFARIWRLLKTIFIAVPIFIVVAIIQSILGNIMEDSTFLFTIFGVSIFSSLGIAVINWLICDLLNIEFLDNGVGKAIKLFLYCTCLIIAIVVQLSFTLVGDISSYNLFSGNSINDALILGTMMAPFISLYFGYKASLDDDYTEEYLWLTVPYSVGGGLVLGIALSIIFSILPFLQSQIAWLMPVLSTGALIIIMIICKSIPFIELDFYRRKPSSRRVYSGTYSSGKKSVTDRTTEKDWWNKY